MTCISLLLCHNLSGSLWGFVIISAAYCKMWHRQLAILSWLKWLSPRRKYCKKKADCIFLLLDKSQKVYCVLCFLFHLPSYASAWQCYPSFVSVSGWKPPFKHLKKPHKLNNHSISWITTECIVLHLHVYSLCYKWWGCSIWLLSAALLLSVFFFFVHSQWDFCTVLLCTSACPGICLKEHNMCGFTF